MPDIEVDTSKIEKRISDMMHKIDHMKRVEIGHELSEWQTADLDRKKPFTMRFRSRGQAKTVIRPHSLFEVKRSRLYQSGMRRRIKRGSKSKRTLAALSHYEPKTSTRPILRQAMEDLLWARMRAMLDKLKW
jgi:hypothetical protein